MSEAMAVLVHDCPRCGANNMTFKLHYHIPTILRRGDEGCEAFCICSDCHKSTVFVLEPRSIEHKNWIRELAHVDSVAEVATIEGYISTKDKAPQEPPGHLPKDIEQAFREGARCVSVACYNAACCMFRLCIDLATKPRLPEEDTDGLNRKIRRELGLRLPWLFDNKLLPEDLRELSLCIKDYGDDGAHHGVVTKEDAEDTLDFTVALLKRLFTEPDEVRLARQRQKERRKAAKK